MLTLISIKLVMDLVDSMSFLFKDNIYEYMYINIYKFIYLYVHTLFYIYVYIYI